MEGGEEGGEERGGEGEGTGGREGMQPYCAVETIEGVVGVVDIDGMLPKSVKECRGRRVAGGIHLAQHH